MVFHPSDTTSAIGWISWISGTAPPALRSIITPSWIPTQTNTRVVHRSRPIWNSPRSAKR
jgi:hypothetical protein